MLIKALVFVVVLGLLVSVYDVVYGLKGEPAFYKISSLFCITRWVGITLPPLGIFICPERFDDVRVRRHELVHWEQYGRYGTIGFYVRYALGWVAAGFSYDNNWMEQEARRLEGNSEQR